jgi:integrase
MNDIALHNESAPRPGAILDVLLSDLPELPPVLRYYDEFDDQIRTFNDFKNTTSLEFWLYGKRSRVDLEPLSESHACLLKHLVVQILADDLQPQTAALTLSGSKHLSMSDLETLVSAGPFEVAPVWKSLRAKKFPPNAYGFAKSLLKFLCRNNAFGWTPDYLDHVGSRLPLPAGDAYAGVRSGDAFLTVDEEAALVRHLDSLAIGAALGTYEQIADAAMLLCCLQFGMRPVQVASVRRRDVRLIDAVGNGEISCHVTFHVAKQRGRNRTLNVVRRVKQEWVPLFRAVMNSGRATSTDEADRFFGVKSNSEVSARVWSLASALVGSPTTATDLRHTAAQRLVDSGASHEELAEFLCHSQLQTGLVYFTTAASHAELVNRAIGASDLYRHVVTIAHAGFISEEELSALKDEQQIGAVPHGIPIAGIGGCTSGQPACPSNPVLSCYGCRKFMPVRELPVHEEALTAMRSIVLFFVESSRSEEKSPTYLQLQQTIGQIQAVMQALEGASDE